MAASGKATLTDLSVSEARSLLEYLATAPGTTDEAEARRRLAAAMRGAKDDDSDDSIASLVRDAVNAKWLRHPARR
jgi:hypothetical protein